MNGMADVDVALAATRSTGSRCRRFGFRVLSTLGILALGAGCAGPGTPDPGHGELRRLIAAEEQRDLADRQELLRLLNAPGAAIRARTARALGRIRASWCVLPLGTALGDTEPGVRAAAAWGLGQLEDPAAQVSATTALLTRIGDPAPEVRTRVVDALGRVGSADVAPMLLRALEDAQAEVRQHAALALDRLQLRVRGTAGALAEAQLERLHAGLVQAWNQERGAPGAWRYVYALAKLRRPEAGADLDRVFEPGSSEEARIFAVRGLAELVRADGLELPGELREGLQRRLLWLLRDDAPRLRIEAALALGDPSRGGRNDAPRGTPAPFADAEVLEALAARLRDENPQVARVAALGLGHFHAFEAQARQILQIAETSTVPALQSAAIEAQARLLGGYFASTLAWHAKAPELHRALAAAAGLRFLSAREAVPILQQLADRPEQSVRVAALGQLAVHREDRKTIDIALARLSDPELAVREAAASALAAIGEASCIPALRTVLAGSAGEDAIELRQEILTAVARIAPGSDETRALLRESLQDPSFAVRRVAHRLLSERAGAEAVPPLERPEQLRPLPLPEGADFARFVASRPELEIETSQGTLRVELWPDVAPVHVWNLLTLCENGRYDGRTWHRVVPNFVVQGGDATGTGSGSRSSFGFRLRDELGPRPFTTGVLGMPRSAEPNTGGEQIFVTLVPTPHLDGRYTAFGALREGLDVLVRLSVGDRIVHVRRSR